jgi:tRNA A-37 threonylcarbamoyl transferase component Bud32
MTSQPLFYEDGSRVALRGQIGKGGEATIYAIDSDPKRGLLVAKVYTNNAISRERKIRVMISNTPDISKTRATAVAWPSRSLYDKSRTFRGFVMPRIQMSPTLAELTVPKSRRSAFSGIDDRILLRTSANIARVFSSLHERGYVVGDVNDRNIHVRRDGTVSLVDADSMQVRDGKILFKCPVFSDEFTAPERLTGKAQSHELTADQDTFGLAVIVFRLLMHGWHPHNAVRNDNREVDGLVDNIRCGVFAHAGDVHGYTCSRVAPRFEWLDPVLRQRFLEAFVAGHDDPTKRPSAEEWVTALENAESRLQTCETNQVHRYWRGLTGCPQCDRSVRAFASGPARYFAPVRRALVSGWRWLTSAARTIPTRRQVRGVAGLLAVGALAMSGVYLFQHWSADESRPPTLAPSDPAVRTVVLPTTPEEPALRVPPACGTDDAFATFQVVADWHDYRCRHERQAHDIWESCLPRAAYSDVPGSGCPGDQLCCPPSAELSSIPTTEQEAVPAPEPVTPPSAESQTPEPSDTRMGVSDPALATMRAQLLRSLGGEVWGDARPSVLAYARYAAQVDGGEPRLDISFSQDGTFWYRRAGGPDCRGVWALDEDAEGPLMYIQSIDQCGPDGAWRLDVIKPLSHGRGHEGLRLTAASNLTILLRPYRADE